MSAGGCPHACQLHRHEADHALLLVVGERDVLGVVVAGHECFEVVDVVDDLSGFVVQAGQSSLDVLPADHEQHEQDEQDGER